MRFHIYIYILYVIIELLFGGFRIAGLSPRILMTILLFCICLKQNCIRIDINIKLFLIFLFLFILSGVVTGYTEETLKYCLSWYFSSFVMYQASNYMIEQHNGSKIIVYLLLFIGFIDAIVTIGQSIGNSYAYELGALLTTDDEYIGELDGLKDRRGGIAGVILPGIVGATYNGLLLPIVCVLSFYSTNTMPRFYNLPVLLISLFASFLAQERTGTVIACVFSVFLITKYFAQTKSIKYKIIVIFSLIAAIIAFVPTIIEIFTAEHSRYNSIDRGADLRQMFFVHTIEFVKNYPLGGYFQYLDLYYISPHNVLFNILIYGGLVGGVIGLIIYVKQFTLCWFCIAKVKFYENMHLLLFSLAYLTTILNSLTHNCSFIRGDSMCWLLLSLLVSNISSYKSSKIV